MIRRGIEEGRRTFANTLKYVLTTTSANLGNLLSMAAASLFLPFLPLSSVFDVLTFVVLLGPFRAAPDLFRTAWFVESLLTELVIALVVRTRRPFYRSQPGTLLAASTAILIALALAIPFLPLVGLLGFVPLPGSMLLTLCGITGLYVVATEVRKRWFFRSRF